MTGTSDTSSKSAKDTEPKKWKNLGIRAVTAIIFASVCFAPFYFGGLIWALLIILLGARVIWEWVRMSDLKASSLAYIIPIIGFIVTITYGFMQSYNLAFLSLLITAILAVVERLHRGGGLWAGLGFIYIGLPSLCLLALRGSEIGITAPGFQVLIFIILVVIAADTGAYFGGSHFQGPKMAPRLSPKKTWSGFVCGCLAGMVLGALLAIIIGFSPLYGFILAGPVVILAVMGDFLESAFKRALQVKDAGGVLPGHGGLLDRLDSLLLVAVVTVIVLHFWPSVWPI